MRPNLCPTRWGQADADDVKGPEETGTEHVRQVLGYELAEGPVPGGTGVGHYDVYPPERVKGGANDERTAIVGRHVGGACDGTRQRGGDRPGDVGVDVVYDDGRAVPGEQLGVGVPEPTTRPRDDDDAAVEAQLAHGVRAAPSTRYSAAALAESTLARVASGQGPSSRAVISLERGKVPSLWG